MLAASFFLRLRTAAVQNPSGRRKLGLKWAKNAAKGGDGGSSLQIFIILCQPKQTMRFIIHFIWVCQAADSSGG